jgi:hypothetical protein
MWLRSSVFTVLAALTLGCAVARADDPHRADEPDAGFLEFLGSVDRLSEVNPDYLSQAEAANAAKPGAPRAPPPPPPPPPRQPLPPSAAASGGATHE